MRPLAVTLLALAVLAVSASAQETATRETNACAALGAKHPGSAADRAMGDRIADRFRAAGLETSIEPFHLPVFVVRSQSVAVTAPKPLSVKGETFAYGGAGTVAAE